MNASLEVTFANFQVTPTSKIAEATCGKTSALIWVDAHRFRVICQNASHKVWRGFGRLFRDAAEASEGFKSAAMKAIIAAVNARTA